MEYSGFWRRFLALIIDIFLLIIVSFLLEIPLLIIGVSPIISFYLFDFIMPYLYFTIMQSSNTQATIGKMIMGIKVVDLNYNRISFARSLGRSLATIISSIILLIGYLIQPFTKKRQTLHDIIAGTLVVKV